MIGARIIKSFAIGYDHAKERAQLQKLMPVSVVAGETRSIETDYQAGIAQSDLGNQLLEALAVGMASPRLAEILVNNVHAVLGPTESDSAIDKAIL